MINYKNNILYNKYMEMLSDDSIKIIKKFKKSYQNGVGFFCKKKLHKNSLELLEVINQYRVIDNNKNYNILEIGGGGCRNLKYIQDIYPKINFYANDLHKESIGNMHKNIKRVIHFYDEPTQIFIKKIKEKFDLIIDSDHLVHVNYNDNINILNHINNVMKPKYFLIRSITIDNPNRRIPYHKHDFNKYLTNFEEIYYKLSVSDKNWYIKLFKLKN